MRLGVVILPDLPWPQALARWREAEERGFATAWTYDHLSWRNLRDGPWLGTVPLLGAVAASTQQLRIGTLVTTPNFRHPALLAKDAMTLDHISGGRFELGLGAGGVGYDDHALGQPAPSRRERADRFDDFVSALDVLLREPMTSYRGSHYTAVDSRTLPGCTQQPRVPFTVAAAGRRALAVTARHGEAWVTYGPAEPTDDPARWWSGVAAQGTALDAACDDAGRDPGELRRLLLLSLDLRWAQSTREALDDTIGRAAQLGFTDVVLHWPRAEDAALPGIPVDVFDALSPGTATQPVP